MVFRTQQALFRALRRQDSRALEAAIDEFGGYVMAVALNTLGSLGSRQDAEEITSDVFVALWKNAPRLAPDSNLKPWLAVVARNTSLKRLRSLRPVQSLDEQAGEVVAALMALENASHDAVDSLGESDEEAVDRLLEDLNPIDREVLRRRYCEEQDVDTIAQETSLSQPAVKSRLYRGRKVLRGRLA
jgi:RNA polymerase sigma-70 factor (ECF subfamily)